MMIAFRRLLLRPGDGDYGDMTFFKLSWNTTDNVYHKIWYEGGLSYP